MDVVRLALPLSPLVIGALVLTGGGGRSPAAGSGAQPALVAAAAPAPLVEPQAPPLPPTVAPRERAAPWRWPLAPRPTVLRRAAIPEKPWQPGHRGIDLAGPPGRPVLAVADGVVAFSGAVAGRPVVSVLHADGLLSTYEPVAEALPTGTPVVAGLPIGVLAPGHERGALHLGARRGVTYVDPLVLLGGGPPVLLPLR